MPDAVMTGPAATIAAGSALAALPLLAWPARRRDRPAGGAASAWLMLLAAAAAAGCALVPAGGVVLPLLTLDHGIGLDLLLDRVSLAMAALIGLVGAAVTAYSGRQLVGDAGRDGFMRALALTIACAFLMVLSGNLAQLALAWIGLSAGLHRLLTHHRERDGAITAARHKFVVSRIGDAAMLGAIAVLLHAYGTLGIRELAAAVADHPAGHDGAAWAALLLAIAAIAKSAQVPLHGWLPDTLEAPTAVSALMHAGIINAGGFLLVRMSPLMAEAPGVLTLLAAIGAITAVLGVLAMWAQTDIKKALAWSTVAQMGFMVLQCGLGAFAAALVHLLGHGCYKAQAFLRSGSVPAATMPLPPPSAPGALLVRWAAALASAAGLVWAGHAAVGADIAAVPGGWVLAAVIALAAAHLLAAPIAGGAWRGPALAVALVALAVPGLHAVHGWFGTTLGDAPDLLARGAIGAALAVTVASALVGLATLGVLLPWFGRTAVGQRLRIHAHHGFYLGLRAERIVRALWSPAAIHRTIPAHGVSS